MIAVNVTHGIKPIEVEGETYALKKGDSAYIPTKLAGAMIKRRWATKIPKPERLGEVEGVEARDVSRCYPHGYPKEEEAVGKYEWLTRLV